MEHSPEEISVSDPVYIVRKRLGEQLDGDADREQQIQDMAAIGGEVDHNVATNIRSDYEQEIGDVLSDMGGGPMGGGMEMENPVENFKQQSDEEMSDEEARERMKKFMRVSSLQIAYRGYTVFKSIVMN